MIGMKKSKGLIMTRKERLMAAIRGEKIDRPPVSFYELDGLTQDVTDNDPFNIYTDPTWQPLIDLTIKKSDRIVLKTVNFLNTAPDPLEELTSIKEFYNDNGSFCRTTTIKAGKKTLTQRTARDKDVDTIWTLEHFIKDIEDFKEWINLPVSEFSGDVDVSSVYKIEEALGDSGIVCLDMGDPLCEAASLFEMGEYTIMALTEPELFHRALEKISRLILKRTEAIARALPGRLWRIYGPEYACPPYLPPRLFREYVVRYDKPIIDIIRKYDGYPRMHLHGNLKSVLDDVVSTGCIGLDPIEPPPQGDVSLRFLRKKYGNKLVLFGNLELSDIEIMGPGDFELKVREALEYGPSDSGRGFILMPSASPIGRKISPSTFENYKKMIEITERLRTEGQQY
jgi:Uroporphyrinogen decarboxylase (URO-D)